MLRKLKKIFDLLTKKYINFWRKYILPDMLYKWWLKLGMISEEKYRNFQRMGYIKCDIDPEYIQKKEK